MNLSTINAILGLAGFISGMTYITAGGWGWGLAMTVFVAGQCALQVSLAVASRRKSKQVLRDAPPIDWTQTNT